MRCIRPSAAFFRVSSSREKRSTVSGPRASLVAGRGARRASTRLMSTVEGLARPRAELPLEEIAERLLEHVLHTREIALANAPDQDLGQATLRIQSRAIDRGPHEAPARSSRSVMIPE